MLKKSNIDKATPVEDSFLKFKIKKIQDIMGTIWKNMVSNKLHLKFLILPILRHSFPTISFHNFQFNKILWRKKGILKRLLFY